MTTKFSPLSVDIPSLLLSLNIEATRTGDKWKARCPSGTHSDDNPSWDIRDDPGSLKHGLHHCFSCGYEGTTTDLVQKVLEMSTTTVAREWIEKHAMGKPIAAWNLAVNMAPLRKHQFAMPSEVTMLPFGVWLETPSKYVTERGITPAQVERWSVGYAINGRLNGRIVFPTHNAQGRVVNYTARTFVSAPKRYLTPAREENPDFNVVYGERFWPAPTQRQQVIVTEGVINTLAVERCTPLPVACLNGSNPSLGQLSRLSTFSTVIIMTDQDYAGDKADQDLSEALTRHTTIKRVRLPTRCAACGHELDEHVQGKGCRCCTTCKRWQKQDPASMRRDMLMQVLQDNGLPCLDTEDHSQS